MLIHRMLLVALLLPSTVAVTGGCSSRSIPLQKKKEEPVLEDLPLLRRTSVVYPKGSLDLENSHASTVKVLAEKELPQEPDPITNECSGVLVAPRLVLTAGHCVCIPRKLSASERDELRDAAAASVQPRAGYHSKLKAIQGIDVHSVMDESQCMETAKITATLYAPRGPGKKKMATIQEVDGQVKPHPDLEILRDASGMDVWVNADLAVIILETAVTDFPVAKMLMAEPTQSPIVLTGYGRGDSKLIYGDRHHGRNEITRLRRLDSGSIEILAEAQKMPDGKAGSHVRGGDSGGGCWSTGDDGREVLIGIASAAAQDNSGQSISVFTSLYPHEGWLRQHLAEALAE